MSKYLALMRVHQYIKNLFVFAPLFFSFNMSISSFIDTLVVFIIFSLIASSIYILNDLLDVEEDRKHPKKKFRPIVSGEVSVNSARMVFLIFSTISLFCAFVLLP